MRTAVGLFLEIVEKDRAFAEREWYPYIPGWQIDAQFPEFSPHCPERLESPVERRRANALVVEFIKPSTRCRLRLPDHWPDGASALRWLGSGGSPLVFGECSREGCPLIQRPPAGTAGEE